MNKKRITEFSIYLQAFMRRIVTRFQIPGIFLMMKRWKWWKNFQSLFQQKLKVTDFSHQIGPFSKWRKTNGLLWCWWWKQKKYTPEECVQSRNMLSSAIRSIYRDFCWIPPCKVNCFRSWKISMVHHFLLYCEITSTFQDRMFFLDEILQNCEVNCHWNIFKKTFHDGEKEVWKELWNLLKKQQMNVIESN